LGKVAFNQEVSYWKKGVAVRPDTGTRKRLARERVWGGEEGGAAIFSDKKKKSQSFNCVKLREEDGVKPR